MGNILFLVYGERWTVRNMFRRATCRRPIIKRKKPKVGWFPLPDGKIVPFEEYVQQMGETPDLLEARPLGWDENKEERRVNKRTRKQLFRSIKVAAAAFFFFSYGYNQISLMQNYLHESQFFMEIKYMPDYFNTYGHVQLLAKYCLAGATAMFIPYLMRIFQDKWILFVSAGGYGIFVSLGFLDAKYTIMPSGFAAGLSCIPFFTTFSMYMVHVTKRLGDLNLKRPYNGIQTNWLLYWFNTFVFVGWFLGYGISSGTCAYLFHDVLQRNNTFIFNNNMTCGRLHCDKDWPNWWDTFMQELVIPAIDKYAYANLANASLLIIVMGCFLFGCMEGQTTKTWSLLNDKGFELNFKLGWRAIFSCKNFKLAPIFIFTGWATDFIAYTYPKAYPICSINSWYFFVGLALFGLCGCIVAGGAPWLALKKTGWNPIMIAGVSCYVFCIIFLLSWTPVVSIQSYKYNAHNYPAAWEIVMFAIIPAIWGIGTAALYAAINVKIQFEYPDSDEMIQLFSVYHHWYWIGVLIGYGTRSMATCTDAKLYALLATLVLGVALYVHHERKRLRDPAAIKAESIKVIRFIPNPDPEKMANESDVEDEGTSTSEEEEGVEEGKRKKRVIKYKRQPPPNDPRLGKAWRTPHFPPDLEIPRKYITPDGHIMIMPKHTKPPFTVQDSFDSNNFRKTNLDDVSNAARKVCFRLGWGGHALFYDINKVNDDERENFPCKFDDKGNVLEGQEDEPDYYEEDLASNPVHNIPERFQAPLEALRQHQAEVKIEEEALAARRRRELEERRREMAAANGNADDREKLLQG